MFSDDHAAGAFRKLGFASQASPRQDYTLRHRCGVEVQVGPDLLAAVDYPTSDKSAEPMVGQVGPSWRAMPWEIIAMLELKRIGTQLDDHLTQILYYCHSLVRITPGC